MAEENAPTLFGAVVSERDSIASHIAQTEEVFYLTGASKRRWVGRGDKLRLVSALAILAVIAVWYVVTALHMVSPVVLPTPLAVLQDFQIGWSQGFASKTLFADIEISFVRVAEAFVLAVVIGVPIGLIMAQSDVI